MAPIGTLWIGPIAPIGKVIKAVAALAGLELDIATYEHNVDNKKPEFLNKFPRGQVPAFESANGLRIFESVPIARYVASLAPNSGLLGTSPNEAALVDQWIHFAESEVYLYHKWIYLLCIDDVAYSKPTHVFFTKRLTSGINALEKHLSTRTFFVGERITLADLYIAGVMQRASSVTFDAALRVANPNLVRHLETIVNRPELRESFGETIYAEKAIQPTPPSKEKKPAPPSAPPAFAK